jgi:hypothetical protein
MGKYGQAAEIAAKLLAGRTALSPRAAWVATVTQLFPHSVSSQTKGCPRDSFLAICELGVLRNVAPGTYTRSVKNKGYAIRALTALRRDSALSKDETRLWQIATKGAQKAPNSQMDVVATLFRNGFIR